MACSQHAYPEYDEDKISADWLKTKNVDFFTSSPAIEINQIPVKQVSTA